VKRLLSLRCPLSEASTEADVKTQRCVENFSLGVFGPSVVSDGLFVSSLSFPSTGGGMAKA
jgi:hypothetical protein